MPKYLGKVELGGFYLDNVPLLFPTKPWRPDSPIIDRYNVYGDIPSFKNAPNISRWTFGNTPTDKAKRLTWVKIGLDNGKSILICDRVILYSSRSDLGEYITGKNVSIDGMTYRLRALTGGANYKNGPTTGGERPNEWDSYICNEANLAGIPTPLPSELSRYQLKVDDLSTESNKFWNHVGIGTLCQELYRNDTNNTIVRGGTTPLYHYNVAVSTTAGTGFRPVLEVDNDPPTISGVDENLGVKSSTFDIPYTIDDFNSTDTLTVTEKLQGNINTAKNMVLNSTGTVKFTDQGILIHDQPSESNSSWAMRLNSTGFAIANGKNADGSWNFRTFGTGKGFTADEITAGTLEAIVIKGVNILASSISGGKIEGVTIEGSTIYAGNKASGNYTAITQNGEIRIYEKGKRVVEFWKSNNGGYLFLNTADGLDAVRIQPLDANTGGLDLSSWNGSNLGKTRILSRGMDLHCSLKSEGINIINANTFVQGDFQVTGAKNALVHTTEFGDRVMYAYEGTRSKFFDEGVGFLKDGICEIHLNPMFLSTIEPLDKARYQVQLTPFETSLNLYVERLEHDKVRIRSDTQKEGKFFWHISGIRKGYADEFMKQVLGKEEYAPRDIQIQRKIENMKG